MILFKRLKIGGLFGVPILLAFFAFIYFVIVRLFQIWYSYIVDKFAPGAVKAGYIEASVDFWPCAILLFGLVVFIVGGMASKS